MAAPCEAGFTRAHSGAAADQLPQTHQQEPGKPHCQGSAKGLQWGAECSRVFVHVHVRMCGTYVYAHMHALSAGVHVHI